MDELKRGFWGYKKDSVYHYIVSLEEKASERVAEKESQLAQMEAEMKRQIAGLESESRSRVAELEATVNALREENKSLRKDQAAVFSTMLEAQRYAEQLRADSARQNQQAQERFSTVIEQKTRQLDSYLGQIQQLRAMVREMLKDFDDSMEEVARVLTLLPSQAPSAGLDEAAPAGPAPGGPAPGEAAARVVVMPTATGAGAFQSRPDKGEGEEWKRISFT